MINVKELFSDSNAKIAAKDFVECFKKNANSDNLDFDFYVNKGKMVSGETNTFFKFNSDDNTFIRKMMEEVRDNDFTDEVSDALFSFEKKIFAEIQPLLDEDFRKHLRKVVLNNAEEYLFPLKTMKAKKIGINPSFDLKADGGYTLVVNRLAPKNFVSTKSVANELIQNRMKTGKTFDELIAEGKVSGDLNYKYVSGYSKKYYDSEFSIDLWIDYSPAPFEEVKKYLEAKQDEERKNKDGGPTEDNKL